jgi:hypothetical protein
MEVARQLIDRAIKSSFPSNSQVWGIQNADEISYPILDTLSGGALPREKRCFGGDFDSKLCHIDITSAAGFALLDHLADQVF